MGIVNICVKSFNGKDTLLGQHDARYNMCCDVFLAHIAGSRFFNSVINCLLHVATVNHHLIRRNGHVVSRGGVFTFIHSLRSIVFGIFQVISDGN